eukprot:m.40413 g.40413  ORF g.40413 m.40413 type:complete len:115 (-) comp10438_c0_seq1:1928-2272(-)
MFGCRNGMSVGQWLATDGPMYIFVILWLISNVILFITTYQKYHQDQFTFLRFYVNKGLPIARGAASMLNFNCALILVPVCRNLVNVLRGLFEVPRQSRECGRVCGCGDVQALLT